MGVILVILVVGVGAYVAFQASSSGGGGGASSSSGLGSDPASMIALAIGVAEGGYDASGSNLNNGTIPSRNHNPGDLTVDVNGTATGTSGNFTTYASDAAGYAALVYQVNEWLNGSSANAGPNSTISDISQFYTTTDQSAWATNVASVLGVSTDTQISAIGGGNSAPAVSNSDQNTVASADTSGDSSDSSDDTSDSLAPDYTDV